MGECSRKVAKFLLNVINKIFFVAGIILIILGVIFRSSPSTIVWVFKSIGIEFPEFQSLTEDVVRSCGIYIIVIGGFVTGVAFFGMVGASCKSKCMLGSYAIVMIILVLAQIGLIIFVICFPDYFRTAAGELMEKSLQKEFKADYSANGIKLDKTPFHNNNRSAIWHAFQLKFHCCGSNNYTDYSGFKWQRFNCTESGSDECTKYKVPISCCKQLSYADPQGPDEITDFKNATMCLTKPTAEYTNVDGCTEKIIMETEGLISKSSNIAIGVTAGIIFLEIILIAMAFVMCCRFNKEFEPGKKYERFN